MRNDNRRRSRAARWWAETLARLWHYRFGLSLGSAYFAVFFWLLFGQAGLETSPGRVYAGEGLPMWEAPSARHVFGTTFTGIDVLHLSRLAMATTASFAFVVTLAGLGAALVTGFLIALSGDEILFGMARRISRSAGLFPLLLVVVVIGAGSGGAGGAVMVTFSLAIFLTYAGQIATWLEERQSGGDVTAGIVVGLSRASMVSRRDLPAITMRTLAVLANVLPPVMLAEMALSFVGVMGDRISCGGLLRFGVEFLAEAPWLTVYPGVVAFGVVAVFALLGWCVSGITRIKPEIHPFP